MLEKEIKTGIISRNRVHDRDSGSCEVQVALLTERVNLLSQHLKANRHDYPSQKGLLKMVAQRRRLLTYLSRHNLARYQALIDKLNLRK